MNTELLVCDATHFRIDYEINPYMDTAVQPDSAAAVAEHRAIIAAHEAAGRRINYMAAVPECPDMVYTANAALVRGDRAVLAHPPLERQAEMPYFRAWLVGRGFDVIDAQYPFSGQGDALACGDLLLAGYGQRTDRRIHAVLAQHLGYEVVPLRNREPAVVRPRSGRRGYQQPTHPRLLPGRARRRQAAGACRGLGVDLIEVAVDEAARFALNLVSDGSTVTMTRGAPRLAAALRARGLQVVEVDTTELQKGGGGVRCTALTLDNPPQGGRHDIG